MTNTYTTKRFKSCQEINNNYPGNVLDLTTGYDEGRTRAGISDSLPSSAIKVNSAHQDTPGHDQPARLDQLDRLAGEQIFYRQKARLDQLDQPAQAQNDIQEVKHIWGDYLSLFNWDYFTTNTFARTCYSPTRALARVKKWCCRWFFRRAVMFIEDFAWSDGVHVHGLVKCNTDAGLKPLATTLWKDWFDKFGRNTIVIYEKDRGAEHYLTKYITKDIKKNDYLMWGRKKWWKDAGRSNEIVLT